MGQVTEPKLQKERIFEAQTQLSDKAGTYHVPGKIGQPVDSWVYSTDKLQMLGFVHPLLDQEEDKAGRDEGHGKDNADGHHDVSGGCGPVIEEETAQKKLTGELLGVYQGKRKWILNFVHGAKYKV